MEITVQESKTYTLTLTERESELLAALVDFPEWGVQPEEISEFLEGAADLLCNARDYEYGSAEGEGFVGKTSVPDSEPAPEKKKLIGYRDKDGDLWTEHPDFPARYRMYESDTVGTSLDCIRENYAPLEEVYA